MAWGSTPRTWAAGLMVTAAILNADIRDKLLALSGHAHTGAAGDGAATITPTTVNATNVTATNLTAGAGIFKQAQGANLAAGAIVAGVMTIGADGNTYRITAASTTISSILPVVAVGAVIHLIFDNAQSLTNGGGFVLQGGVNWAAPAGSAITLKSLGSGAWYELSRWTMLIGANFMEFGEMTAPSAPGANSVRIYAVDNGGKTELLALFPSGAAQSLGIEP